jgi:hypothetical protein
MPEPTLSDDLQDELAKLLARSRKLRRETDELEGELQRVASLIAEDALRSRAKLVMGSLDGGPERTEAGRPFPLDEPPPIRGGADPVDPLAPSR